jgi:hypothetical protein
MQSFSRQSRSLIKDDSGKKPCLDHQNKNHSVEIPFYLPTMKPTVVICPGAWPVIKAFGPIIELLEAEGYPTQCVDFSEYRTQPFVDEALINPDCAYLRKRILMPLINEGTCIILLMHSYGGVYGASSLEALSRETRSRDGRKGGIIALVFVAAFVCLTGASLNTVLGIDMENLPRWLSFEVSLRHPLPPVPCHTNR